MPANKPLISAETTLLLRQPDRWCAPLPLLIVEPPEAADVAALLSEDLDRAHLTIYTSDRAVAAALPPGLRVEASAWLGPLTETATAPSAPDAAAGFAAAIVYMPKSKARLEMLLAMVAGCLRPGATAWLVGHNHSGVGAAPALSAPLIGPTQKVDAARHCELYAITRATLPPPALRDLSGWRTPWTCDAPGLSEPLAFESLPGVFSHGRLDDGTARLLRVLNLGAEPGAVLDVGCGAGVIGAWVARRWPQAALTCTDVSLLAVASTAHVLRDTSAVSVVASDVFSGLGKARFDHIISNPPFHRGLHTDHAIAERLIAQAPDHLNRGGSLWVVVNRFRDAAARMEAAFGRAPERLYEDSHFTVLRARATRAILPRARATR